ncbi:addiction module antidote protein [Rhizobium sp. CSW-27]|uniref:addiction module antidote protein n=1 Tax=Rhizobium sp. CSW-27 TaxID=2839985 RepID=UPI001C01D508|nr:addiction module antidote protein [Rhizobium sp. CSW-27]MBT9372337.1 putative addiction module antidote protein [Rhizobium sp. CSW-27]
MPAKTTAYDSAEFLDSDEAIEEYMIAAFETEDPAFIAQCLGTVARARNMSQLSRQIGMSRSALYKALSGEGNPEFGTIMKVMQALGIKLHPRFEDLPRAS